MISVILCASDEVKGKALAAGFEERTVLIKHDYCQSTEENKQRLEREVKGLQPFQFLVGDYWGMMNPD